MSERSVHDEIAMLLPWYANGTLQGAERTRVEDHVRDCIVCRRELAAERRTVEAFRNEGLVKQSAQAGFERLQDRISGTGQRNSRLSAPGPHRSYARWREQLGRLLSAMQLRPVLLAVPLATVVLALALFRLAPEQAGIIGVSGSGSADPAAGGYRTLSNAPAPEADDNDILVVFAADADAESIRSLLATVPARLVSGPNSAGAYTIRLHEVPGAHERQAAITGLRQRPEILFAEAARPLAMPQSAGGQP